MPVFCFYGPFSSYNPDGPTDWRSAARNAVYALRLLFMRPYEEGRINTTIVDQVTKMTFYDCVQREGRKLLDPHQPLSLLGITDGSIVRLHLKEVVDTA